MTFKILSALGIVFGLSLFAANNANAQDAYADSSFTKLNSGKKLIKKLVLDNNTLDFDDIDTDKENSNNENTDTYGIGNVIGKKKSGKANKKAGKSIKVEINLTGSKVLEYELKVDKGKFSLSREILTD
ncbi:MAG: hypothetical protein JXQ87_10540 [Bacteroidia bacterium]